MNVARPADRVAGYDRASVTGDDNDDDDDAAANRRRNSRGVFRVWSVPRDARRCARCDDIVRDLRRSVRRLLRLMQLAFKVVYVHDIRFDAYNRLSATVARVRGLITPECENLSKSLR